MTQNIDNTSRLSPEAFPFKEKREHDVKKIQQIWFRVAKFFEFSFRAIKFIAKKLSLAGEIFVASANKLGSFLLNKISSVAYHIFNIKQTDQNKLVKSKHKLNKSQFAWHLNLGLLRSAYEKTTDPVLKEEIKFLANNYLAKSAPVPLKIMSFLSSKFDSMFQIGANLDLNYHRMAFRHNFNTLTPFDKRFALAERSALILTDTSDCTQLLSIKFNFIAGLEDSFQVKSFISAVIKDFFSQYADQAKDYLSHPLTNKFLIDFTSSLSNIIETDGNSLKEKLFNDQFLKLKTNLDKIIDDVVLSLINEKFNPKPIQLKKFIRNSIIPICRLNIDQIAGIKILPFYKGLERNNLLNMHPELLDFIDYTGLYIGALNLRRYVLQDFNKASEIHYAVKGSIDTLYFANKDELIKKNLFRRLDSIIGFYSGELKTKPHIANLGQATIILLKGLIHEITESQWQQLTQDPIRNQIIQACLFKICENLATAELWMKTDFKNFANSIELVHSEITTLLALFRPFSENDFEPIYLKRLAVIPTKLQPYTVAGLGKTATNIFSGINSVILEETENPIRVYSQGFYFEQAALIGENKQFENVLHDQSIQSIDLYAGQFNPGIEINADHSHYSLRDIIKDIQQLSTLKSNAKSLTIAIDCTTDYFNSEKVNMLLTHFEKDIIEGSKNFIFFRSGQKFDMLGMDNYYGSPFFMVNNKGPQWNKFNRLLTDKVYKTDSISLQWFCLVNKYASDYLDGYRSLIFKNTRSILRKVPKVLLPNGSSQKLRVSTTSSDMNPSFIDIKVLNKTHALTSKSLVGLFYKKLIDLGIKVHSRASFGFFHANCIIISINSKKGSSTIRINPGINPEENAAIIDFLTEIAQAEDRS